MAKTLFIQLRSADDKDVEGAASIYNGKEELPPGQWSVMTSESTESTIMEQEDMPEHWQKQIKMWGEWADRNLPIGG
jgi:hypothetical protein